MMSTARPLLSVYECDLSAGKATIYFAEKNEVFYNPVQVGQQSGFLLS